MSTFTHKSFDSMKQSPSLQNETQFHKFKHHRMSNSSSQYETASLYTYKDNASVDSQFTLSDSSSNIVPGTSNNFFILDQLNQKQKLKHKLKQEKIGDSK